MWTVHQSRNARQFFTKLQSVPRGRACTFLRLALRAHEEGTGRNVARSDGGACGRIMKVQTAYIFALARALRDSGVALSSLGHTDGPLDENEFYRLCGEAVTQAQDATLALRFGSSLHVASHGVLGCGLMSCSTLRQAAEFLVQHNPVRSARAHIRFMVDQREVALAMTPAIDMADPTNFLTEAFFAAAVTAISELVGADLDGCRIEFSFEPRLPVAVYRQYLRMPVVFGRAANRLVGPRSMADAPLAAAQNVAADIYVRQCGELLRMRHAALSYASEVRRVLMSARGRIPSEYDVARELNVSGRTLRRRLLCEGHSFQDILDDVRNNLAKTYLGETGLNVAEVGLLLGFEDAANFRRAFRRWNGCSPQHFREVAGGGVRLSDARALGAKGSRSQVLR